MTDTPQPNREALIRQFEADVDRMIRECHRIKYPPRRFEMMVRKLRALGTAQELLRAGPPHDGFTEVAVLRQRPKLTIEFLAQVHHYRPLFTDDQIEVAQSRTQGLFSEADFATYPVSFE